MMRRSWLVFPFSLVVIAVLVAVGAGFGTAYAVFQPPKSRAEAQLQQQDTRLTEMESVVAAKEKRIDELLTNQGQLQQELEKVRAELKTATAQLQEERKSAQQLRTRQDEGQTTVAQKDKEIARLNEQLAAFSTLQKKAQNLQKTIATLDNDRLLLVEMRKDPPDNRKAAQEYWESVKKLAVQSDSSLGPKVDRILRLLPVYFDWIEKPYGNTCDYFGAFFDTGAVDYSVLTGDFEKDVFLVVIKRIDALATQAQ